jgi:hypothetical protein
MTPELFVAICAGATLLLLWTTTVFGGAFWFQRQLKALKTEILADFDTKHKANEMTVKALEALVIRHDVMLNAEFNGAGKGAHSGRHS